MTRLSQKELLTDGFRSALATAARGAAAVGGALKSASHAGVGAGVGDVVKGAKAGYKAEKERQKTPESELDSTIEELGYIRLGAPRGKGDVQVIDVAELDYDGQGVKIEGKRYNRPLVLKWDKENKSFKTVRGPKGEEKSVQQPLEGPNEEPKPFEPKVGEKVLVRTSKNPHGEPGTVKAINPGGAITVVTAGNPTTGFGFNPKNVIPSPRAINDNNSQKDLLRQLTLLCD
tara:strand:- start:244 stop:936 length:693 start_codon:yes stop_codon:yes gene_type:complete